MVSTLSPALRDGLLDSMPVARLAVTGHEGRADAMPIVFARVGDCLVSPIDGKPKKTARLSRLDHIRQQPAVTLLLDHYASDWETLWWLRVLADAEVTGACYPRWDEAVSALRRKYPQYEQTALFIGEPTLVVMHITALRWWAAAGEAGLDRWLAAAGHSAPD